MSLNIINSSNLAPIEFYLFSVKHTHLKWVLSVYNNPFLIHATIDNEKTKFLFITVCDKYQEELFNPWSLHEWLPSTIKPLLSGHLQGMVEWPLNTVQVPKNRGNIKNQFKKNYHFMWLLTTYCTKTHSRIALTFWGGKHGLNLLEISFSALFKWFCFI